MRVIDPVHKALVLWRESATALAQYDLVGFRTARERRAQTQKGFSALQHAAFNERMESHNEQ